MSETERKLSRNAQRVLLFEFVCVNGLPKWEVRDGKDLQAKVCMELTGLGEQEVLSAYAELEDAGMIEERP